MRLFDRLLARQGYWEGQASGAAVLTTTYGSPDREAILPQVMSAAQQAYGLNGVVFSAVLLRLRLFSEARFVLQSVSDKKTFTDQRLDVLQHPWPDGTEGELLVRGEQDAILAGNGYIWDAGDRLVRWRPDWVTIISAIVDGPRGPYRQKVAYHFEPPKDAQPKYGDPQMVPAEEVAHFAPIPDPQASFRGMSPLTPVLRDAQGDSAMTAYKIKYLQNAASPNLLIKYPQKLQPGTIDAIRERIQARYGGVDNAFKTLVLDQGADTTVIGNSLQQMDFSAVQQGGADRVLAALETPGVLVGLEPLRGAGRGYEESMLKFGNTWARPEWRAYCGAVQKLVPGLPPAGIRLWFDTSDIAALQASEQTRAQVGLIHAQTLLTLAQAAYTQESAVKTVMSGDLAQLQGGAQPPQLQGRQPQHLLPQPPGSGPAPGLKPLPEGSSPRLPVSTVSAGDGGNLTRPTRRPASVRRDANGHGGHEPARD